ncbi:MAG: PBP1A family penicillin-binding protein [Elusimicrobiaceae bacterium]|uniref:PBP1A family penicillin-binding protein n=1 Tax=Candidatus Avelusimicrobium gallicola TaxID=2562704 RepID=A0A928DQ37_9BACT|nr:PBP1A family penicillin-binding protein [Elusimicrobium sp.]MBQ9971782.1 PBP1A family penicillin-binding protein [Elusimicrobiaceae bacterium]
MGKKITKLFTSRFFIFSSLAGLFICILAGAVFMRYIFSGLPPVYEMEEYTPSLTTKVFDRNNNLIHEFSIEKRSMVPLEDIPVDLQNAVVAMEDRDFFSHAGFSVRGILRALIHDIITGSAKQGASTLTQQLSRGVFLTQEKKIIRKIREIILAIQIEHQFSKREILQLYLNEIYLGSGAYGVKAAAKKYFDKELSELTTGEAALIVGLIPAPGRYNPFANPETAKNRRNLVLDVMHQQNYISKEELEKAKAEPLPEKQPAPESKPGQYFIEHIRRMLEPKYGMDVLWKAGLNIYTTVDIEKQAIAEKIMNEALQAYDEQVAKGLGIEIDPNDTEADTTPTDEELLPKDPEAEYPRLQGAFMVRDVKSGAVRVMVGGRAFGESKFNRVTQAKRQPGSSFKPYVWMAALQKGYTPATLVKDLPTMFYYDGRNWRTFDENADLYSLDLAKQTFIASKDFNVWVPQNYGGRNEGWITLRKALEKSKNLVAVNLIDAIGVPETVRVARKAGLTAALPRVPALALGVSVLQMDEHLAALSTFANGGIHTDNYYIERVEDANGRILEQHIPLESAEFSPQNSYLLINMMKGVTQRGSGAYVSRLGRHIAGKTGTTQSHRDMWFVGMTPHTAAAAWMGYDDDTSHEQGARFTGSTTARWWTSIMEEILKDEPNEDFAVPEGISLVYINPATGKLAMPSERNKFLEAFISGTEPQSF